MYRAPREEQVRDGVAGVGDRRDADAPGVPAAAVVLATGRRPIGGPPQVSDSGDDDAGFRRLPREADLQPDVVTEICCPKLTVVDRAPSHVRSEGLSVGGVNVELRALRQVERSQVDAHRGGARRGNASAPHEGAFRRCAQVAELGHVSEPERDIDRLLDPDPEAAVDSPARPRRLLRQPHLIAAESPLADSRATSERWSSACSVALFETS